MTKVSSHVNRKSHFPRRCKAIKVNFLVGNKTNNLILALSDRITKTGDFKKFEMGNKMFQVKVPKTFSFSIMTQISSNLLLARF